LPRLPVAALQDKREKEGGAGAAPADAE